jgi:hypothetical protein
MATKKNSPTEPMIPENEEARTETENDRVQMMANTQAELKAMKEAYAALQKENAELKKNSIYSPSPFGSEGDYERVQKACAEAAEKGEDPWKTKISVKAPRIGKGEDSYWLSVNGRTVQIPANEKYFELALPFAQCLVDEIKNRNFSNDYVDSIEVFDPKDNPKREPGEK